MSGIQHQPSCPSSAAADRVLPATVPAASGSGGAL